ncbi:MAG: LamG domain-containing protein, partial [Candidatus Paceibacterota bacterium]
GNYYTYITGGSWELTSSMESAKYKLGGANDKTSKDGGSYTGLYELGTNLTLLPLDYGDTSLVGYWKFDEGSGTTAYDASGHNNNGTLTNGPTYTTGKVGSYALSFDGTDDWVNIGNGSIINFGTGNFSIVFYFKTANLGGSNNNAFIGNKSTAGGANPGYHINTNNGKIRVQLADGVDAPSFDGLLTINDNNYHLCAIVINKSSLAKIYIDNVLDNSLNDTMLGNTNGEYLTSIGAGAGGGWHRFSGVIDDIRIYNRALSAAEISALYNATNK